MTGTDFGYHLRLPSETKIDANTINDSRVEIKEGKKAPEDIPLICCCQCFQMITSVDQAIEVDGHHQHVFANPHGMIFNIVCFRSAAGCVCIGNETCQWSWFQGYSWKAAVCKNCFIHIGWRFASKSDMFNGLIHDRLLYPE
jgi:hypothetical protein